MSIRTYDYELRIKPWRELTLLADYVSVKGLHFGDSVISAGLFNGINIPTIICYEYYVGMGYYAQFKKDGTELEVNTTNLYKLCDRFVTTKEVITPFKPDSGDSTEEYY